MVFQLSSKVAGTTAAVTCCLRIILVRVRCQHQLAVFGSRQRRSSPEPLWRHQEANELMAHSYAHLFGLPTTGLRFFTVYGPWNRPDMAMWLFADAIIAGRPIKLFNHGRMRRDFTYVDDVVESIIRLIDHTPRPDPNWTGDKPDPASSSGPLARLQHREPQSGRVARGCPVA